ncbi:MAG TPA: hypothetical protein VHH88_02075 [Verrucomicrobiae bacterium]|nr:hypothetical protein [Verrucomicrobiae bacterium]
MNSKLFRRLALLCLFPLSLQIASAWDYEGHRLVNQLALASLPADFPAFAHDAVAADRIAFLAGEPDRWRNNPDLPLRHVNGPDHYIDIEELAHYDLKPEALPMFRDDFIAELAIYRHEHPDKFAYLAHQRNDDHTRQLVGLLPWAIVENFAKLKSCFAYLKAFEQHGGTPEEIANAQANVIYVMGILGHFAGDASQPLHSTIHHHGWVGENPNHYSTDSGIHSKIDGFFKHDPEATLHELTPRVHTAETISVQGHNANAEQVFRAAVNFIVDQQKLVEPLYKMEKAEKFEEGNEEGKAFLEGQLLKSGQLLGSLWVTAWQEAPTDKYLSEQLARRHHTEPTPAAAAGK